MGYKQSQCNYIKIRDKYYTTETNVVQTNFIGFGHECMGKTKVDTWRDMFVLKQGLLKNLKHFKLETTNMRMRP